MNSFKSRFGVLAVISCLAVVVLTGSNNFSSEHKFTKALNSAMNVTSGTQELKVWVEFTDKGEDVSYLLGNPLIYLTERSLERRNKVKPGMPVDFTDLPLNSSYVNELRDDGFMIVHRSKWFNRVSVRATRGEIDDIASKDFVKSVDIVRGYAKDYDDVEFEVNAVFEEADNNPGGNGVQSLNYGASLAQMQIINGVTAHDSGYFGQGVLIASFDTGVDNLPHPSFDSLRARGIRTYDFVNHDTVIANQSGQMGEGSHGTATLSLVGGYRPGNLIAPAFRSRFIIAKTENTDSETPVEEDNWIAAAEWADSLGADIITSSLGYLGMDQGSIRSYDWTWMNGDSCVITIGADLAVNKGIIVVNSAGNEGFHSTRNTLLAPADGDSVIAIGSVNSNRQRSSFSSVGNTTDGRIKPDVCALGSGNVVASSGSGTGYTTGSGTSFSCPMTAGVCAMMLSANRNLTPMQVREILRQTADSSFAPNRRRGWGLVNAWEAVKVARMMTSAGNSPASLPDGYSLNQNYPNPFNPVTVIGFELPASGMVTLKVYDILGREVMTLVNEIRQAGAHTVSLNAGSLAGGAYFYRMTSGDFSAVRKFVLLK